MALLFPILTIASVYKNALDMLITYWFPATVTSEDGRNCCLIQAVSPV